MSGSQDTSQRLQDDLKACTAAILDMRRDNVKGSVVMIELGGNGQLYVKRFGRESSFTLGRKPGRGLSERRR